MAPCPTRWHGRVGRSPQEIRSPYAPFVSTLANARVRPRSTLRFFDRRPASISDFGESFGRLSAPAAITCRRARRVDRQPTSPAAISDQPSEAFDEAVDIGLLDRDTGTFRHPLMRPAVLDRLGPAETRQTHGRIAAGLRRRIGRTRGAGVGISRPRSTGGAAMRPRSWRRRRWPPAIVARYAKPCCSTSDRPTSTLILKRRAALLVDAADAALLRYESKRVLEFLDEVAILAPSNHSVAAKAAEVRSHVVMWERGPSVALPILEQAIARVEEDLPDVAVSMLAVATVFAETIPDARRVMAYADRAEELATSAGPFAAIAAQFAVAVGSTATGDSERAETAFASLDPVITMLADLSAPEFEHVLGAYGALQTMRERWTEGRALLDKLLLRADRLGAVAQSGLFAHTLGHIEWFTGDWLRALSLSRRSVESTDVGPLASALGRVHLALVEATLGLSDAARESIRTVEVLVEGKGASAVEAIACWAHALLLVGEGDEAGALVQCQRAVGIVERGGLNEMTSAWWHAELVESLWANGRVDEAASELKNFRMRALRPNRRGAPSFAARLEGLLHEDPDLAHRSFDEAERLADLAELPFARARTAFARARWCERRGDRDGAAKAAIVARTQFDRLGAALFSKRCTDILGADPAGAGTGSSSAAPSLSARSSIGLLSPAELRVVEVIVRGATIKQAAELLILSSKTIDAHLQQVYRKLGIRSRAELASRFERERPPVG